MWLNFSTGPASELHPIFTAGTDWAYLIAAACRRARLPRYREDIMSDDTVISTMINGYRSHKFPKPRDKGPS